MGTADYKSPSANCKRKKIDDEDEEEFFNNITDDLLLEILIRLPNYRFATCCSLVCKRWCCLILCRNFIDGFFNKNNTTNNGSKRRVRPTTLLLQVGDSIKSPTTTLHRSNFIGCPRRDKSPPTTSTTNTTGAVVDRKPVVPPPLSYDLNFLPNYEPNMTIRASFNDLLLVSTSPRPTNYCICNPRTRQSVLLPNPPRRFIQIYPHILFGLSCEKEETYNKFKYKYRVLLAECRSFKYNVAIFQSETGKWSETAFSRQWIESDQQGHGQVVFFKGFFYWLDGRFKPETVVAFNPDLNRSHFIALPIDFGKATYYDNANAFLGVCQGRLRLIKAVLRKSKRNKQWKTLWRLWERIRNDDDDVLNNRQTSCSWILVHRKACSACEPGEKLPMRTDKISFHPDNGDVVFSTCNHFGRVFRHSIPEGKREQVLQVVGNDINFQLQLNDDDQMISTAVYMKPKCDYPPVPFHLLHLSPPTPLPTLPFT